MARFLFGILIGVALVPAALWAWLHYGAVPVAVADPPLFQERLLTHIPLNIRIRKEAPPIAPFQPDAQTFIAGAQIYREQCAACHGLHGKPSSFGAQMYPVAPPLWEKHHNGQVVGVSDDPPGETYWKVANGIRLTGMPSYRKILTDTQIWQVSLLLANADKPLPPGAIDILNGQPPPPLGTAKK